MDCVDPIEPTTPFSTMATRNMCNEGGKPRQTWLSPTPERDVFITILRITKLLPHINSEYSRLVGGGSVPL